MAVVIADCESNSARWAATNSASALADVSEFDEVLDWDKTSSNWDVLFSMTTGSGSGSGSVSAAAVVVVVVVVVVFVAVAVVVDTDALGMRAATFPRADARAVVPPRDTTAAFVAVANSAITAIHTTPPNAYLC